MGLSRRDIRDLLRGVGGLLLAIGAVALWARKSTHEEWGGLARLLVVAVPAVLLFVLALDLSAPRSREKAYPWQSVLMVTSILLGPVVLFQFLDWIGVSTGHVFLEAAVFALIALVAAYAALRARVSYAALLAGLSALLAWLLVWDKILDHPSANTYRWLLVAAAALLFFISRRLFRADSIGAPEVATAGGVSAVAAGVFGVVVGAVVGVYGAATARLGIVQRRASLPGRCRRSYRLWPCQLQRLPALLLGSLLACCFPRARVGWFARSLPRARLRRRCWSARIPRQHRRPDHPYRGRPLSYRECLGLAARSTPSWCGRARGVDLLPPGCAGPVSRFASAAYWRGLALLTAVFGLAGALSLPPCLWGNITLALRLAGPAISVSQALG